MSTPSMHVALWEPEIPPNTGNIGRLCAATGTPLHLIGRLGFHLDDRSLKRAGLDYWEKVDLRLHATLEDFDDFYNASLRQYPSTRLFCLSAHAAKTYTSVTYQPGDFLLFGNESSGLPPALLQRNPEHNLVIPMPTGNVRSLNLATTAGIVLYEALRQLHSW